MRILITGSGGFIGSHLTECLIALGHDVTAFIHYNSNVDRGWLEGVDVRFAFSDVRDVEATRAIIRAHRCEAVFHLAALGSVPYSFQAPRQFIETNVIGTLNVALACAEIGAHMIHTSTSEVYGTAQTTYQSENHPQVPHSPYAASKIAADATVESLRHSHGLRATTLRPFNVFGPRQSERAVLPRIILQANNPDYPEIVLGNTGSERDFTYVADTVDAFVRALELCSPGPFNVCSSETRSLLRICRILSTKPVVSSAEATRSEASEVTRLCGDSSTFHRLTGWTPRVGFVEGLYLTEEWLKDRVSKGYCV